jgi:protease-4
VTGGIGVILNRYNLQDTLSQYSVRSEPIKAGENIDMGTPASDMPPEVRDWLQGMADEFHRRFIEIVVTSRPEVKADDPGTFDGRIFTAQQAFQRGLIDQIGYLDDAIEAACRLAGWTSDASVVLFRRKDDPARTPFAITANQSIAGGLLPLSLPGLERTKLPTFLYLWLAEPTLDRLAGR